MWKGMGLPVASDETSNEASDEEVECYGCGDPDCVEPEDPMDARFCKSCNEECKKIDAALNK